jgi:tetratricopeptide (TPR) repeat protein
MLPDRLKSSTSLTAAALAVLAALVAALYLPFLGNPPIFDDHIFFSGHRFYEYASFPLGLALRIPPYFSLAWTQVVFGSIEAHRLVSLLLHAACAWSLFALLRSMQLRRLAAFAGAALFALHPVAVYGAAYLTQRSIVLATLFGLLALLMFLRGLRSGSLSDAIVAAALYSLSVLSKEHAILLPAAAAALVPLSGAKLRYAARYVGLFFAACVPAAVLVMLFSLGGGSVGQVYEPRATAIMSQVTTESVSSPWVASALAQTGLFFKYLATWLAPRTAEMALDLRVDFMHYWMPAVALPAVLCFLAFGAVAAWLVLRRGPLAVPAWGLLYVWIMFGVEFTAVRFQEPFVLYRSYLWAPGLAVAAAAALDRLPVRVLALSLVPLLALLSWQAHDRLKSFSSGLAIWEDAAEKLPAEPIPGGYRPLYEVGREYLYADRTADAIAVSERCLRLYPRMFDCAFARAAIQIETKQYQKALPSIIYAIALQPGDGASRHHLGLVLENLGCLEEAKAQYRVAVSMHFREAEHRLMRIETPGKGLLAPIDLPEQVDCTDLLARNPIPKPG